MQPYSPTTEGFEAALATRQVRHLPKARTSGLDFQLEGMVDRVVHEQALGEIDISQVGEHSNGPRKDGSARLSQHIRRLEVLHQLPQSGGVVAQGAT
ncbi:hypothetical protein ONZ43_g3057 [Nemania bipapillata]|uniref:Uncharacterized protein n=1 Tax=Nemania bipapillata TaxID=110536 RepID=A0ACC2IYB6_9PEZI|nr:hypothetical protein ONZ43_g3057 [Nemania bipapillata]